MKIFFGIVGGVVVVLLILGYIRKERLEDRIERTEDRIDARVDARLN